MATTPIDRRLLRSQIADLLRNEVCAGELRPGDRVAEVATAARLGVSRTPLREALIQLAQEGLVVELPLRGFRVAPFSADEVRELYPVLAVLEGLALGTIPALGDKKIAELERLNRKVREARSAAVQVRYDSEWHQVLLADTTNRAARDLADEMRRRVSRYELAFVTEQGLENNSSEQHEKIVGHLQRREKKRAVSLLEAQWTDGIPAVLDWMRRHDAQVETHD